MTISENERYLCVAIGREDTKGRLILFSLENSNGMIVLQHVTEQLLPQMAFCICPLQEFLFFFFSFL